MKPYLYNGKKVEIRSYLLIASLDPYVVLYRPGHVSMTLSTYTHSLSESKEFSKYNILFKF